MPSKPGQRKRRPLTWTDPQTLALNRIFEGRWSLEKIALDCTVPVRTLKDWIAHPDFQAALQARRDHLIEALDDQPYIRKERRLIGLAQMAESARVEYEARPWLKEERQTGRDPESGEPLVTTNEHFNKDAHAAFREALADIAAELGARKNVTEVSGSLDINTNVSFYLPQPEAPPDESPDDTHTVSTD